MKKIIILLILSFMIFTLESCKKKDKEVITDYKLELFSDGLGFAEDNDGKYGFFNEKFEVKIDFIYDYAEGFNDGVAMVDLNDKTFLINTKGVQVTDSFDYFHHDFKNKIYIGSYKGKSGDVLLDKNGNVLCTYEYIERFYGGTYAEVKVSDGNYGYIDTSGNLVYSGILYAGGFCNGYAYIKDENNDFWTIDLNFNKLHNFGNVDLDVYGYLVEVDDLLYDVNGNYYGEMESYSQCSRSFHENYYYVDSYSTVNFYCIKNDNKIKNVRSTNYLVVGDYILIYKDNVMYIYNSYLEVVDSLTLDKDYTCHFGDLDPYRNDVYAYVNSKDRTNPTYYKFDYKKLKFEKADYLKEYSIVRIYKDYMCVSKDDLYGLITLDGKIVFETDSKELYVATDDGYFVNGKYCTIYNNKKKQIFQKPDWKYIGFNLLED